MKIAVVLGTAELSGHDKIATVERMHEEGRVEARVVGVLKAAVDTTLSSDLPSTYRPDASFAASTLELSVFGKLPSPVRVPLNTPLPFTIGGSEAAFVGENKPFPALAHLFGTSINLSPKKVGSISIVSRELLRDSTAETIVQNELTRAAVRGIDKFALDGAAADAVRPASIYNAATEIDATGAATAVDVDGVLGDLVGSLTAPDWQRTAFVSSPATAVTLSLLLTAGGTRAYPNVGVHGGVLSGLPLVTSLAAPDHVLVLVDASELMLGDGGVRIAASTAGMIESDTAPGTPPPGLKTPISLFQGDGVGLRLSRTINWTVRRSGRVAFASNFAPTMPAWAS